MPLLRWWRTTPTIGSFASGPAVSTVRAAWIVVVLAGVTGGLVAALPARDDEGLLRIVFLAGTGAVGGGLVAMVLYAGCWTVLSRRG